MIEGLVTEIRKHLGCLYRLSEALALLDMLLSFANHVTLHDDYGIRVLFCA